jgi:hypothetical protein
MLSPTHRYRTRRAGLSLMTICLPMVVTSDAQRLNSMRSQWHGGAVGGISSSEV